MQNVIVQVGATDDRIASPNKPLLLTVNQKTFDLRELIQACVSGEKEARRLFQEAYGEAIYNFPVKIHGLPVEQAGDFYVYAFEKDRIFTRIRSFDGRNNIQFRTFLSYYVLQNLFREWRRTSKELRMSSLDTPLGDTVEEGRLLADRVPHPAVAETDEIGSTEGELVARLCSTLSPEERLDLKLLYLLDWELSHEEICLLATRSGRSLPDTLGLLAEVQVGLRRREEKLSRLQDTLDAVWGWILIRQKELQDEHFRRLTDTGDSSDHRARSPHKKQLEQMLAKRYRQKERLVAEIRTFKVTTPYKAIAHLLNTTAGSVRTRICRLREQLAQGLRKRQDRADCN